MAPGGGTAEKLRPGSSCKTNIQHKGEQLTLVLAQSSLAWGCSHGCSRMERTGNTNLEKRKKKKRVNLTIVFNKQQTIRACLVCSKPSENPCKPGAQAGAAPGAGLQTQAVRGALGSDGRRGKAQPAAQGTRGSREAPEVRAVPALIILAFCVMPKCKQSNISSGCS